MFWKGLLTRVLLVAGALSLWSTHFAVAHSNETTAVTSYRNSGDFTLRAPDGPLSLRDLRGKVVLIFFGYTSCPDVCPLTLARINASFSALTSEELKRVQALFITLDPERDTAERLREYTSYFHPNIIGLTDSAKGIKSVTGQFGVRYTRKEVPNSALGYLISHPTDILLLDREGQFVRSFPHDTDVNQLLSGIRGLLNATN